MLKALTFAGVLVSASVLALVQPVQAAQVMIDGRGAAKCSTVTSDYKARSTATANDMMGWAYGYMTRRNVERAGQGLQQVNLQTDKFGPVEMVALMLQFCEENPEVRYFTAVDALYEVLLKDQGLTS